MGTLPSMASCVRSPAVRMWMLILGVAALGIWPYLGELGRIPMTADGRIWLEKGHPGAEGWFAWVFETRHFQVGYRPVTAVTYTATDLSGNVTTGVFGITVVDNTGPSVTGVPSDIFVSVAPGSCDNVATWVALSPPGAASCVRVNPLSVECAWASGIEERSKCAVGRCNRCTTSSFCTEGRSREGPHPTPTRRFHVRYGVRHFSATHLLQHRLLTPTRRITLFLSSHPPANRTCVRNRNPP